MLDLITETAFSRQMVSFWAYKQTAVESGDFVVQQTACIFEQNVSFFLSLFIIYQLHKLPSGRKINQEQSF
jgi:hypothetical protein